MNILLFGPPGAGKGTQSSLLVEETKRVHISTGNLFREAIKNKTDLGLLAKVFIDKGQLVPDNVTINMVKESLKTLVEQNFILDGFPRTVVQAEALKVQLKELNIVLGKVIFLDVPHENLLSRLSGRRICKSCGENYNIENKPPIKEEICDFCEGKLVRRPDDSIEAIIHRLKVYQKSTAPLKEYYKREGLFVLIEGLGSAEEVFERVQKQLMGFKRREDKSLHVADDGVG